MTNAPNKSKAGTYSPGFLDTVEEAIHLLRSVPPSVLFRHIIGTVPFTIAILYFWSDMSRNPFALDHCVPASLAIATLFVWMKGWQTAFACGLKAALLLSPEKRWTISRVLKMILSQTAVQPSGLVLIPLSMLVIAPFHSVHAFYQNFTLMADGTDLDLRRIVRRSLAQASLWPMNNIGIIWLFSPWLLGIIFLIVFSIVGIQMSLMPELRSYSSGLLFFIVILLAAQFLIILAPFAVAVAGNIVVTLIALPKLIHAMFGLTTPFSFSGFHAIANSTFLLTVFALCYLALDPITKAAYVLRCYHGESLKTGEDILAELRLLDDSRNRSETRRGPSL